jgi:hypothetical protein
MAEDDVLKIMLGALAAPWLPAHSATPTARAAPSHAASDIHLGINERDPIRGDDARHTFEEIFSLANEHNVRMPQSPAMPGLTRADPC